MDKVRRMSEEMYSKHSTIIRLAKLLKLCSTSNILSLVALLDDYHRVLLMKVVKRGGGCVMRRGRANNGDGGSAADK